MTKPEKLYTLTLTLTESEARDIVDAGGFLLAYVNRDDMGQNAALDFATKSLKSVQKSKSFDRGNGSTTDKLNQMLDELIGEALNRL